jgi:ribonuclease Z
MKLTVLGCGAALPTPHHFCSSQVLTVREKLYMIDCAEGIQMQLRRSRLRFSNLNHIFITHLHGDHCFGLMGLISTFALLGRTADLHVYGPAGLYNIFKPQIDFFCQGMQYTVTLHELDHRQTALAYEDRTVTVHTIPLRHRIPCIGYLFREKQLPPHIRRDAIDAFGIPVSQINNIKAGMDWTTSEGDIIPNSLLTTPAEPAPSFAYCSDTMPQPGNAELLQDVTLLYHEATFMQEHELLARKTFHSTALQAAEMARTSNAHRLLIGHFSSRYRDGEQQLLAEAQALFPNTIAAKEGLTLDIRDES